MLFEGGQDMHIISKSILNLLIGSSLMILAHSCSKTNFNGAKKTVNRIEKTGGSDASKDDETTPELGSEIPDSKGEEIPIIDTDEGDGKAVTPESKSCGGLSTSLGCFYAIGQHTKIPIDMGLQNVPTSCDNFCSSRGGSDPVVLTCAQCAPLFKALYTGPDYQCSNVNPSNLNIDMDHWKKSSPNDPPGFAAAYAASCVSRYAHYGKGGVVTQKYAPDRPHYDMTFGRIYSGGAVHWGSYICRCKQ